MNRSLKKIVCAAFAAFAGGALFASALSTTPAAWKGGAPDSWQMRRHNEKLQEIAAGGAKVVFIGDSITHFWETKGKAQLAKYFSQGDWKMLDLGTSADRTEHVLWRLQNGELDGYSAKFIHLMIGTNNTGHRGIDEESPADTVAGIRAILDVVLAKQPDAVVVLSAIFPRDKTPDGANRLRNDKVNAEIAKFVDGERVFWVDYADDFLAEDGTLPKDRFPDFLHPSAEGYEIWYRVVKPYIDYALSDRTGPKPQNRYAKPKPPVVLEGPAAEPPVVRVMTYNARLSAADKKTPNEWRKRREDFARAIERENPDIFGLQEVLPDQRKWLEARLPGYAFSGDGRNSDRVSGEASPVAYRKSRFEKLDAGTFWLSETPDVPGSKSWNTAIQRICTYAILKDNATGKTLAFANTHTDHISAEAREKGMLLIIERMKDFGKGCPIVFTGDHNCLCWEAPAKAVSTILNDALYISETPPEGSWRTFNFWHWEDNETTIAEALKKPERERDRAGAKSWEKRIDYIYVSPGARVLKYRTICAPRPGTQLYPSDHFPSVADVIL